MSGPVPVGAVRPGDEAHHALAAFMAELAAAGVRHVIVSPGSRSTPLTLAAWWQPGLAVDVVLDERVAAFRALGLARASRRPVALVCTSGTAAANYLPAVVEANHGRVPLVVLTADRPPELREWGAGQTIDQVRLYGSNVRWYAETPVPGDAPVAQLRRTAVRAVASAVGEPAGPVHLNVPLREPLEPHAPPIPPAAAGLGPVVVDQQPGSGAVELVAQALRHPRGLVLAGPADLTAADAGAVAALAAAAGWPIVADPLSGLRRGPHVRGSTVLGCGHHLLGAAGFADPHVPDVVLRLGDTPTSKPARLWLERNRPRRVLLVGPPGRWEEPSFTATDVVHAAPGPLARAVLAAGPDLAPDPGWLASWTGADAAAAEAVAGVLADGPLLAPLVSRVLGEALPEGAVLVAASSMAIRDVDGFLPRSAAALRVLGNRGANGIDGLVATAGGVAAAGVGPTVLLLGDLALLHDVGGLVAAAGDPTPLVIVVVDDGGGGIFSHLPIAARGEAVAFERLFRTPPAVGVAAVCRIDGIRYRPVATVDELVAGLAEGLAAPGATVLHVVVDHDANLGQHRAVGAAVAAALR